ncbi:MAG: VOC family protein [Vicinamibacterales bacterium]
MRPLADFWCAVLDYKIIDEQHGLIEIAPRDYPNEWSDETTLEWKARVRAAPLAPSILFAPVPEDKVVKNRLHVDVSPIGSQDEEVARLLALGATKADIGQGNVSWVVMRDPEGNEFCVLRSVEA